MLFNSVDFAIFLPVVFLLYWFVAGKNLKIQNLFIVLASYIFYGWWDWRFLSLILFSTVIDFSVGLALQKTTHKHYRKLLLWLSICVNIGLLGVFKYYDFFLENFNEVFLLFGAQLNANTLNIILPVGISFYTFQTLSYTIDAYKKKIKPVSDFVTFAAYVSFFPQLVAGPIERATHLIPQFLIKRTFNYQKAIDGLRQILWGLFKKIVIADNCAETVQMLFSEPEQYGGSTLLLGAILFALQIYGDFSGYSDVAIGTARLFGFNLMKNFAFPYFSRDIAEFWRRWHISLSTWFRDYLYIPLGGSRGSNWIRIRNTFIIFIVSGFWHGANWTFIIWGALNALYFLPLLLGNRNRNNLDTVAQGKLFPSIKESFQVLITFLLTVVAWVFFRGESTTIALTYLSGIFSRSIFSIPIELPFYLYIYLLFLLVIEWLGRENEFGLQKIGLTWKQPYRWCFYAFLFVLILFFSDKEQEFIYFQF